MTYVPANASRWPFVRERGFVARGDSGCHRVTSPETVRVTRNGATR
jgi:hypothetical protein